MDAVVGLDVGTTTTKAVLFDLNGAELARAASAPYRMLTPQPTWVEQDPEEIWLAVIKAVRRLMAQVEIPLRVRALCMAAQSGSLLPAAGGKPVYPLITWMDGRTQRLVQQWRTAGVQDTVRNICGWSLHPGLCLPTVAWLQQHDPDTFAAAAHYFSVNDFIAYRLTGELATNPSNGSGMQFVEIRSGRWSDALCALVGISPQQLSPIRPAGAVIGTVLPDVCRATGLPDAAVLVNGGHDQGCTALALGVDEPGKLLLACGTAWVITGVMASPDLGHVPAVLDWNFHPIDGRYTISQSLGGLGASLEWWINVAWRGTGGQVRRHEMFAALDKELAQTTPDGALFFLPLMGGHAGPATTQRGYFAGLQMKHSRADMARAVLESAAFELRWALEGIYEAGLPVERLWMVGGAAQSPHWPQVLADVTGMSIMLPDYDNWPSLGAAILAGVGIGAFRTVADGLARFRKPVREIVPDVQARERYDAMFVRYRRLAQARVDTGAEQ